MTQKLVISSVEAEDDAIASSFDRTSKFAFVELVERADMQAAARFLEALVAAVP